MARALPTFAFAVAAAIARDAAALDEAPKSGGRAGAAGALGHEAPTEDSPSGYLNLFSTLGFGDGLRFNNPYRLDTVLGSDAASLSLTPAFMDLSANMTFGLPTRVQHGASVHVGFSLAGTSQVYVNASYVLDYHRYAPWMVHARIGPTFLLSPDINGGGEIAAGFSYFFTGALGLTSEVAFDLFYGAGTLERNYSVVPILSAQLGIIVDFEVLP